MELVSCCGSVTVLRGVKMILWVQYSMEMGGMYTKLGKRYGLTLSSIGRQVCVDAQLPALLNPSGATGVDPLPLRSKDAAQTRR